MKWDKFVGNKKQDYSEFILQEFVRYEQKIKKECQKQTYGRERFISDEEKSKLLTEDTQNIPRAMDDSSLQMSCIPNEAMHDIHKVKFIDNKYVHTEKITFRHTPLPHGKPLLRQTS